MKILIVVVININWLCMFVKVMIELGVLILCIGIVFIVDIKLLIMF